MKYLNAVSDIATIIMTLVITYEFGDKHSMLRRVAREEHAIYEHELGN